MKKYLSLLFALALASLAHAQPYVTVAGATFPASGNLAVGVKANGDPIAFLVDATGILQTAASGGGGGGGAVWVAPPSITVGGYSLLANGNMASGVTAGGVVIPILCDDTGKVVISGGGGGSGTVTVVGSGSLTSTALVTGGGTTTLQTPSATATMDSSGNISTPGGITTGAGGSAAGYFSLGQGTAASTGTTNITFYAPTSVTSYKRVFASTVGSTGFPLYTVSGTTQTESLVASTGTGNVVRADSPALTGTIGINEASPQQMLHLAGTANVNTLFEQVSADALSGGLLSVKARGTPGIPDFPSAADVLLTLGGGGWNGTTLYNYNKAAILLRAYNTWVAGGTPDNSTDISFGTTPSASTTRSEVFRMSNVSIQAFSPFISTTTARTTLALPYFTINTPADTGITASTEGAGIKVVTGTRTWATTGTVALQREVFFAGPTYASASASQTFTDAFNVYITPPVQGTNAIFTRGHSLGIVDSTSASSSITGGLVVATTLGTTATSVGIGGGNINAGGTITAGGNITGTVLGARAANLGTFASPDTTAGAITWTAPVYNIYTSAASTRTYTLPAASSYTGQAFILNVAVGTGHVNVQPASGAQLVLAGVLLTANHYVQAATSAPGNYICFISDGTNWTSLGSSGTWADAASP